MDIKTYDEEKKKLKKNYDEKLRKLMKKFAILNNSVGIGDVVTDFIGSVKVEKIAVHLSSLQEYPSCVWLWLKVDFIA